MDPRSNSTSGLGLPQPGNDMGQLPPIHAPQTFHAPSTPASHFEAPPPQAAQPQPQPPVGPASIQIPVPASMQDNSQAAAAAPQTTEQQLAQYNAAGGSNSSYQAGPVDDTDAAFDEEWVNKTRAVVQQTHADPYLQSQELGKIKAQYIKLRYNKDIKVSEE